MRIVEHCDNRFALESGGNEGGRVINENFLLFISDCIKRIISRGRIFVIFLEHSGKYCVFKNFKLVNNY